MDRATIRSRTTAVLTLAVVASIAVLGPATDVAADDASPLPGTWVDLSHKVSRIDTISDDGSIALGSLVHPTGGTRTAARVDLRTGVVTDLGSLGWPDGAYTAIATGTTGAGHIVGYSTDASDPKDPPVHPFVWDPTSETLEDLGTLCSSWDCNAGFTDANPAGSAVGWSEIDGPGGGVHAIRHDTSTASGVLTDLGTLGGTRSVAEAIADDGTIVGSSDLIAGGPTHAMLWNPSLEQLEDLGTLPGDTSASATGIDPSGRYVVGWSEDAAGDRTAFVMDRDTHTTTPIPGPAGSESWAADVNESGLVVGTYRELDTGERHGFLYDTASDTLVEATTPASGELSSLVAVAADGTAVGTASFGLTPPDTHAAALTYWNFPDVPPWHPFTADVDWCVAEGVVTGFLDGTYRPASPVTRGAMTAYLHRAAGAPPIEPPATPTFPDVPTDHAFSAEIEWAAAEGIVTGFPDGTYRPGTPVSRGSMCAYLHRDADGPGPP